jgi:hypothetical protein
MLPKIKDFSPLLTPIASAGSVGSSGMRKASSGVSARLNTSTMANQVRPIGVDGGRPGLRVARDPGRGRRPVRRVGSGLRHARRPLRSLADCQERQELRCAESPINPRAALEVALKGPAVA